MTNDPEIYDAIIVGGGLAGSTSAIHLAMSGKRVLVFEKNRYPRHKVCGEYVSNEVLPYLNHLGLRFSETEYPSISKAEISTIDGRSVTAKLPLGGFGISRFRFDQMLYDKAVETGCSFRFSAVADIGFANDVFLVSDNEDQSFSARVVIGAFGKFSSLDKKLSRKFLSEKSHWIAVKAHYRGDFPSDVVGLHNFRGGYCGISRVEDGTVNVCWIGGIQEFRKFKNIEEYQQSVVMANPHLKQAFLNLVPLFDEPLAISQVHFNDKPSVERHILMTGDAAGLVHPLCGNGMAMAIHSGKLAAESALEFLSGKKTRLQMELNYSRIWNRKFRKRMSAGRMLAKVLQNRGLSNVMMKILSRFPSLLRGIIKQTHGREIEI